MQLPALTAEEKAYLVPGKQEQSIITGLSERVRGSLTAALGLPVRLRHAGSVWSSKPETFGVPTVVPGPELISCWIRQRFGGMAGKADFQGSDHFSGSLLRLLEHAWAETVINLGRDQDWPPAIRLELGIQEKTCGLEFSAMPESLMAWAELEIKRTR